MAPTKSVLLIPSHGPVENNEPHAISRLEQAYSLIQSTNYDLVVVSGGTVWGPDVQKQPLAVGMANWLTERIPVIGKRLVIESSSRDTFENLELSLTAIRQLLGETPFHLTIVTEAPQGRRIQASLRRGYKIFDAEIITPHLKVPPHRQILELIFLIIHQLWPIDGGPLSEAMRRKRTIVASGANPDSLLAYFRQVRAEKWPGWKVS